MLRRNSQGSLHATPGEAHSVSVLSSFQYLQVPPKARNLLPTTLSKKSYNIMGNEGFKRLARDGYFYKA